MMKILIVSEGYPPLSFGGITSFAYELSSELARLGHQVIIVTRGNIPGISVTEYQKVIIYRLYSPSLPLKDTWFYLSNLSKIIAVIKKESPDIIHDVSGSIHLIPWISKIAPVILTYHGSPLLGRLRLIYSSFEDKLRSELFKAMHKFPSKILGLFNKPDVNKLVFVSKSCFADTLMHTASKRREELLRKSIVIYNGISVKKLQDLYFKKVNHNRLVFSGRLMEYKGVSRLIRAIPLVAREVPEVEVFVLGSGPRLRHLKNLAVKCGVRNRVRFLGWLERTEVLKILASSSILVHPSLYESFGYSIIEAYALGKPVIVHRAPYSIELVENMGAGVTVNSFNKESLANAIIKLLDDPVLYKNLSHRAYQVAKKYFDISKIARKYIEVYEEVWEDYNKKGI